MLELRRCPRCRGDVRTNRDVYGEYRECLQCGYMVDVEIQESPKRMPLASSNDRTS
jgi:Zn ribbon nucleic-acid-binding protein